MGGLQLDAREHALQGGKSGPALVPGKPDESLLIRAVSYSQERLKMPPQGKLSDDEIATLRSWIQTGAHWDSAPPSPASNGKEYVITQEQRNFWSFRPVKKPGTSLETSNVQNRAWIRNDIDRFILARLESKKLQPVAAADKRTLIRRATIDLIGLPPSPEEVDAFLKDDSSDAFAKVVDRLLASPHYGERWGRFWLDVARYADDDVLFPTGEPFPNAFRYRDWVVQAFNDDMPYDLFVRAQIAGDLMPENPRWPMKPGLGLLALGPYYYKIVEPPKARADERHDRIDVLTRGFLGLTVACARCHDHKYDPIPTKDYYALGGVLASTEYHEFPLADEKVVKAFDDEKKKIDAREEALKKWLGEERTRVGQQLAKKIADYMLAAARVGTADPALDGPAVERVRKYLAVPDKAHPFLNEWERLTAASTSASPGQIQEAARKFEALVTAVVAEKKGIDEENERVLEEAKKSKDPYDLFCKGCNVVTRTLQRDKYVLWSDLFAEKQRTSEKEHGVFYFPDKEVDRLLDPDAKRKTDSMRAEVESLKKALPPQYPFLHGVRDIGEPLDLKQNVRGDPYNLGAVIPRHFLSILSDGTPAPLNAGSGRLQLADEIASPKNPLTARVIVNRIWQHHFGTGIVRTPSNFGFAGDRPSHPELLDYLAARFVESGWSVKQLHREIMLSATYGLSSIDSAANSAADPENRLFWRANRRRLDVESLRDSLLFVTGGLDPKVGGPAFSWEEPVNRRTMYGKVSRFRLERLLTLFDFPDPGITSEQRAATNVAPQKLFFLNSDFVSQRAAALADRLRSGEGDDASRIQKAYQVLFARPATDEDVSRSLAFLKSGPADKQWPLYAQMLLSSNEFSFVD